MDCDISINKNYVSFHDSICVLFVNTFLICLWFYWFFRTLIIAEVEFSSAFTNKNRATCDKRVNALSSNADQAVGSSSDGRYRARSSHLSECVRTWSYGRFRPTNAARSAVRLAYPHSLSYQPTTLTKFPLPSAESDMTEVDNASMVHEWEFPT